MDFSIPRWNVMFSLVAMAMLEAEQPRGISGRTETELKKKERETELWSLPYSVVNETVWAVEKWKMGEIKKKRKVKSRTCFTTSIFLLDSESWTNNTHAGKSCSLALATIKTLHFLWFLWDWRKVPVNGRLSFFFLLSFWPAKSKPDHQATPN